MRNGDTGRLSTGVEGLDAMIGGGLLKGDSTLIAGSPGTGKTTLGLHFLGAGVAAKEPGILVTFEYLPQQIYRDAEKKGWPIRQWERDNMLRVFCTTPDVLLAQTNGNLSILDELVRQIGARRLVLDSMTHFEFSNRAPGQLRTDLSGLMNHLRMHSLTTIVTHEIPQIVGPAVTISNYGLEFLVDNVITLRYVELEGELQKAVAVLKFRGGDHDRKYRLVRLTERGMSVESEFTGVENISGGTARRAVERRLKQLV